MKTNSRARIANWAALTFLCLLIITPVLPGQDDSFTVEFGKGKKRETGTATYKGWTYEQVWSATMKALLATKTRVQESDKEGGTITAFKQPSAGAQMLGTNKDGTNFALFLEKTESAVTVSCQIQKSSSPRKAMQRLFEGIRDLLLETKGH
jgi:hypothetical protein